MYLNQIISFLGLDGNLIIIPSSNLQNHVFDFSYIKPEEFELLKNVLKHASFKKLVMGLWPE